MGRSAKLYKKKPKSDRKQHKQVHAVSEEERRAVQASSKRQAMKAREEKAARDRIAEAEERAEVTSAGQEGKHGRLKSRLWKDLESQRERAGLAELATPKEAGIDYLSQWETVKRRR